MTSDSDRILVLYEQVLRPRLQSLEGLRLSIRRFILKAVVMVGLPGIATFGSDAIARRVAPGQEMAIAVGGFVLVLAAIVLVAVRYLVPAMTAHVNYKARFKQEVVSEIFKVVCPRATYEPFTSLAIEVFDHPGLFNTRGSFVGDDRVRGRIGDTAFEAGEVRRAYRSGGGKSGTTHVVFHGLFFHLECRYSLRGTTLVQPAGARRTQIGDRTGFQEIALDDAAFAKEYVVHATDELEARTLMTAAMREQVLAVGRRAARPVFLGFKGHRAYIGVHYGRALFEPGIVRTTSLEAIQEMADQFAFAEFLVRELNLEARGWAGDAPGDDSLLDPPDVRHESGPTAALTSGRLTEADLLDIVTSGGAADEATETSAVSRPLDSRIDVEHHAGVVTIAYGLSAGFFVLIALSGACLLVLLSALHVMAPATVPDPLAALAATVPALAPVGAFVRQHPQGMAIGAALCGILFTTWWGTRVRKVVIDRDAVRVYRGLRPFPRRYSRPTYGRVVRVGSAVHVGRQEGVALVNPTASPMLRSEEEAAWVAAEMRRALRETLAG